ncbi:MAG: hypothetical protein HFH14_08755, partial [Lachnospiraceae bacterium]|nr:hypothetical protein [Lachnospiraceae bacterium]
MVYKKNWFTYFGYTLFGLLLAFLIILSSGLHIDFSENNIIKNMIILLGAVACILAVWLVSYLFSALANALSAEKVRVYYFLFAALLFAVSVGIRVYSVFMYTDGFTAAGNNLPVFAAACTIGILKLVVVYMIGLFAFGKQGAAAALFLEGILAGSPAECVTLDYASVSGFVVLVVILLYTIYFKRCNAEKMKTIASRMLIAAITLIAGSGIVVSVYLGYSLVVPVVLAASIIVHMLFAGWKQALIPVLGIPALCAAAYIGLSAVDSNYSARLNSEIETQISDVRQFFGNPGDMIDEILDYAESSVMPEDSYTFSLPGGYEFNFDNFMNMLFMLISFGSLLVLFFKKRSALSAYIVFTVGAYMMNDSIMLCNVFIISFCFQEMYEGRDRISYIVNSPFIDVYEGDMEKDNHEHNTDSGIVDTVPAQEAAVSDEKVILSEVPDEYDDNTPKSAEQPIAGQSDDNKTEELPDYGDAAYSGGNYGSMETESYGDSDNYSDNYGDNYGADESSDYGDAAYSGGNYGSAGSESYGDSDNYSAEEASDYAEPAYSGGNYGSVGAESYGDSDNYRVEEASDYADAAYSGGNYGSVGAESYGDSDNYSAEEASDYADAAYSGGNYGSVGAE